MAQRVTYCYITVPQKLREARIQPGRGSRLRVHRRWHRRAV